MIIKKAIGEYCAREVDCFPVHAKDKKAKERKKEWCKKHRLFTGVTDFQERSFALVGVKKDEKVKAYFMDAITGSFYDARTKSIPSSLMAISELNRHQSNATKLLMSWIPAWRDEE